MSNDQLQQELVAEAFARLSEALQEIDQDYDSLTRAIVFEDHAKRFQPSDTDTFVIDSAVDPEANLRSALQRAFQQAKQKKTPMISSFSSLATMRRSETRQRKRPFKTVMKQYSRV